MKKFEFPLARVLDWRRLRVTTEEAKLGRLHLELRGLEARSAMARNQQLQAEKALIESKSSTGTELAAFDSHTKFLSAERTRLQSLASNCRQRIAAQMHVLTEAHRDVRLLERLHDRKRAAWQAEFAKEIDREAEELYLAKAALPGKLGLTS